MKFPGLRRLVYSTCSIHETENENVIIQALKSPGNTANFHIADKASVIPSWHRRGLVSDEYATDSFIRSLPEDGMNGFFVACLERREPVLNLKRKAEVADDDDDLDSLTVHDIHPSAPKKKKKRKKQKIVE